ncbi:hypothetical protein [Nesterenkonia sp.]|uniref:hypothetical protein n=1 Tax=Nesterenkonia sp. TaxID=704201 RepID=UPI0026055565|nr:hypothetical protein [Nesterenkonia sp.]
MSVFPDSPRPQPHSTPDSGRPAAEQPQPSGPLGPYTAVIGWAAALVLVAVAAVVAVWQVNEQIYTPQAAAEQYWEDVSSGSGGAAMGQLSSTPEFLSEEGIDHLLLDGEPLSRSAQLLSGAQLTGENDDAEISFTVEDESLSTPIPVERMGTTWGFFDDWQVSPQALSWFEVEVPGAPQGGIGQVQVNGQPVNLNEETARLSAFVPTAAEISVDSEWLVGGTTHVVTAAQGEQSSAERVTLDLEASDAAVELLHTEVEEFFNHCSDQQVLMPAGCPVGVTTAHRVDAESIEWSFPDPESFSLRFDADGWQIDHDPLVAEVSFDATHHHTGEAITESKQVPFELDVQVGASGEDLIVAVSGP